MPRQTRFDAHSVLHHIMIRGIDRRKIFLNGLLLRIIPHIVIKSKQMHFSVKIKILKKYTGIPSKSLKL